MRIIETKNVNETKKVARILAEEIIKSVSRNAFVIALEGNLGAGKTTFTQGFAHALGVRENALSPTFVLMKTYEIPKPKKTRRAQQKKYLVHIDCYRLDSPKDLVHLGFRELLGDKDAIILIEWADRIKKILPKDTLWIEFMHGKKENERIIRIRN